MSDYTTTTNKLKITELDFDAIKGALKSYLQGQDAFLDYNFEGSAMSILLDVLAYNTHYNGFYVNMLASEMFMDSASLRSSVVSIAKHLGYIPSSRRGASVELDIVFVGVGSLLTIPKNSKFTTKIGSDSYTFLTTRAYTAGYDSSDGNYWARNVEIKEGIYSTITYTVAGTTNEMFEIPNGNADITTFSVAVAGDVYTKADDLTELTSTSKVYFIQEGDQNKYQIYFGDGILGKKPNVADQVQISYNTTILGQDGNGASVFTLAEKITGATSATVSLSSGNTRASGGAEKETTASIRVQAPRQYGLQKRVVTKNDYKTRLENDYNLVDSVRVWGGEENVPPEYGRVFICIKPKTGYVLSRAEERRISEDILKKRNVVTIRPRFVAPDYLFIVPDVTLSYDPRKTTRTADQLKAIVRASVLNYSSSKLSKFDEYFRHSVLARLIDDAEVGITNNNTRIAIKKRIKPILRSQGTYEVHFDNPIYRPHRGHMSVINSSTFSYRGIEQCSIIDRDGTLMIVSSNKSSFTSGIGVLSGIKNNSYIVNSNVGYIDYNTGNLIVKIRPFSIDDESDYIYIAAKPRINDIIPKQNTIITIENSDLSINCIDDTDRIVENKVRGY